MQNLSYEAGDLTQPLLRETIIQNLKRTAEKSGDCDALIVKSQNYRATYSEFLDEVKKAAKALLALGAEKGDRVGIWAPNRFEWVIIQYATAYVGAILVNINPAYRKNELRFALNQSEIKYLIMSKGFRKTNYVEMILGSEVEAKLR